VDQFLHLIGIRKQRKYDKIMSFDPLGRLQISQLIKAGPTQGSLIEYFCPAYLTSLPCK
jgi:hypothetical protein